MSPAVFLRLLLAALVVAGVATLPATALARTLVPVPAGSGAVPYVADGRYLVLPGPDVRDTATGVQTPVVVPSGCGYAAAGGGRVLFVCTAGEGQEHLVSTALDGSDVVELAPRPTGELRPDAVGARWALTSFCSLSTGCSKIGRQTAIELRTGREVDPPPFPDLDSVDLRAQPQVRPVLRRDRSLLVALGRTRRTASCCRHGGCTDVTYAAGRVMWRDGDDRRRLRVLDVASGRRDVVLVPEELRRGRALVLRATRFELWLSRFEQGARYRVRLPVG